MRDKRRCRFDGSFNEKYRVTSIMLGQPKAKTAPSPFLTQQCDPHRWYFSYFR